MRETGMGNEDGGRETEVPKVPFTSETLRKWFQKQGDAKVSGYSRGGMDGLSRVEYMGMNIEWDPSGNGTIDGGEFRVDKLNPENPIESLLAHRP